MTERTPTILHLVLATLGVTFLILLVLLLLPGQGYEDNADPRAELAAADHAKSESEALRASPLAWAGAGLAIGASTAGGIGALILLRHQSRRLEEGR